MSDKSNYYYPKIHNVSVNRDDPNFTVDAFMSYCPVYTEKENEVNNSCIIRCRYRQLPAGAYSNWVTLLESDEGSGIYETVPATLVESESYEVLVGVLDSAGNEANTSIILPSTDVFMERDGELNSISIGEGMTEDNTVSIAEKMTVKVKGTLNAGTLKVGGLKVEKYNRIVLEGLDSHLEVRLPYDEIIGTGSAETTIHHRDIGNVVVGCYPHNESVQLTMWNSKSGNEMAMGAVEDRVLLTGLTAPVDASDAVNKAYVDALIARIQALEEKLQ